MILPLMAFGGGLLIVGLFWHLLNDVIIYYIAVYVYDTTDMYYMGCDFVWQAIPYVIFIVGLICLVLGGFAKSKTKG